jgi:hypothetical protein
MSRSISTADARRALPAVSAALLVALAACSDSPAAPVARKAPAAPSGDLVVSGVPRTIGVWVTLCVSSPAYDSLGLSVQEATTVEFKTNAGATSTIVDNSALDADTRLGFYRVLMPNAISYTATVVALPPNYANLPATKTVSAFVTPTLVSMGSILLHRKPIVDLALFMSGQLVPGQTVKVTGPNGFVKSFTDGSATDGWLGGWYPNDGYLNFEVPWTGSYTVCPTTTPLAGWAAPCKMLSVPSYVASFFTSLTYQQVSRS